MPHCMTKAETLEHLRGAGFPVPPLRHFSVAEWTGDAEALLRGMAEFAGKLVAVRSSACAEDGNEISMAGAFQSILNIPASDKKRLTEAVTDVAAHLSIPEDQIIVQEMVENVVMAGVLATHTLGDGSPYYVVDYDDVSGRTDTITAGIANSRVVHVYRGAQEQYFDSPRLREVIRLAEQLEKEFAGVPLDIEFAVDAEFKVHLLQARRICSTRHWRPEAARSVNEHISHLALFVKNHLAARPGLYGQRSMLGIMPDWNPAVMIGIAPRPLALSLYRDLITRRVWSRAREKMGYQPMPPAELMLTLAGRPYIDVRASFNSFLPAGLPDPLAERLVDAWLDRLDDNPGLHDKVEFEIVHTAAEPGFNAAFCQRYPGLLDATELAMYRERLTDITRRALAVNSSLDDALRRAQALAAQQDRELPAEAAQAESMAPFDLAMRVSNALEQCRSGGTLPFAVTARHAFIAESLLRSAIRLGALTPERVEQFKKSVQTISGRLSRDFRAVCAGSLPRQEFLRVYGHLRPGTYDILSLSYAERVGLFDMPTAERPEEKTDFAPTKEECRALETLFAEAYFGIDAARFFAYAAAAIAGREQVKFIFTRHVSHLLNLLVIWGRRYDLDREAVSMLPVGEVLETLCQPLPFAGSEHFRRRIALYQEEYDRGRAFELSHLIRSERDVFVVPRHRSAPNFITRRRIQAEAIYLDARDVGTFDLTGLIVCIESADPGYDWIFSHNIAGLVTRYGGANSHMAIRCAEYGLPAAIGCGELIFGKIKAAPACILDCAARRIVPAAEGGEWEDA